MENLIYLRTNLEFLKKIFSEDDIAISSDLNFQKKYEGKLRRNSNKYFEFSYEYNGTIDLELEMDSIRYIRNSYFSSNYLIINLNLEKMTLVYLR